MPPSRNSPSIHILHTDPYVNVTQERSVERDDPFGITMMHDLEFPEDLFSDGGFGVYEDELWVDDLRGSDVVGLGWLST